MQINYNVLNNSIKQLFFRKSRDSLSSMDHRGAKETTNGPHTYNPISLTSILTLQSQKCFNRLMSKYSSQYRS